MPNYGMDLSLKLSDKFLLLLEETEKEIKKHIEQNEFYLAFGHKAWAACPCGQSLLALTMLAINLRYDIENLKKQGL